MSEYMTHEVKRLDREIEKANEECTRLRGERDAWSEEAGRRGLALATVQAKYAALLDVCAEFARRNREGM